MNAKPVTGWTKKELEDMIHLYDGILTEDDYRYIKQPTPERSAMVMFNRALKQVLRERKKSEHI